MSPELSRARSRTLAAGERVLLVDRKDRRYLVTLHPGRSFQSHAGVVEHDALIGLCEGEEVEAHQKDGRVINAARYLVLRPTLADVVIGMPRGAQVIYPKDLGAILIAADIFPGARVLEAGVGSGALSMAMLRAGAVVTGYELRGDFAERARANVAAFLGPQQRYEVLERDVYLGIDTEDLDRVVLDPCRVREVLGYPTVGNVHHGARGVDGQGADSGRAGVDGDHASHVRTLTPANAPGLDEHRQVQHCTSAILRERKLTRAYGGPWTLTEP